MEDIAEIAIAYYRRLSAEEKQEVSDIFRFMDKDGNGKITYDEYISHFSTCSSEHFRTAFKKTDLDNNGALDFNEFICWHYLVLAERLILCNGCGILLTGVFFTCSLCFHTSVTYHLCVSCYKNNHVIMSHHHSPDAFLDNTALLLTYRRNILDLQSKNKGKKIGSAEIMKVFNVGVKVANAGVNVANAVTSCSIM